MAAGSDGQAGCHGIVHPEQADQERRQNASENSRENHRDHSHRHNTAVGLADLHGNGGGDGFRDQGGCHGLIQAEKLTEQPDASHGCQGTYRTAHHNGNTVFLQDLYLCIDRHCQAGRGRGQEHIDDGSALVVALIGNIKSQKHHRCKQDRNQQRIAQNRFQLLLNLYADPEGQNTERDSKERRRKYITHLSAPFLRPSSQMVRRML